MCAMIVDLEAHFREFLPPRDELILKLEEEAQQENIPIIGPLVGELLFILARTTQAQRILELGTASGYSAIYLARGAEPQNGRVVTLESDPQMAARAQANCAAAGVGSRVEVRQGKALALMEGMAGPFDFIFLDIDKESYLPALDRGHRLFWWFGGDNPGETVADFEQLFRQHLTNLYQLIGKEPPEYLAQVFTRGGGAPKHGGTMRPGQMSAG